LKSWVHTELMQRSYGAVADQASTEDAYYPVTVGKAFDAIIFIHKTTRATPTKTGLR
jgi:erythromycin esterase-like protein